MLGSTMQGGPGQSEDDERAGPSERSADVGSPPRRPGREERSPSRVVGAAPPAHLTASALGLRWILSYVRRIGLDDRALLSELRISPEELNDPDVRVSTHTVQLAWALATRASGDEAFGLHLAQHTQEGEFDVLDYAASFSGTLGEALDRVAQFYRLASDDSAIQIVFRGATTHVERVVVGRHPQDQNAFFALLVKRFRSFGAFELRPRGVWFEHGPRAERELTAFFGCPVHFAAPRCKLAFASSDLARPVRDAKPRLATVLDRYAAELLARLPASGSYADHVRRVIGNVISRGAPTLEVVAREMHASPRTVQRRLSDAKTTHTRLVEEVRRQLAMRYIESPRLSVTEIAFLLGYEDEGSFRRAFKRWTGKSPARARGR